MKDRVLFVTPTLGEKAACGVAQYGKIWSDALKDMETYELHVLYTDCPNQTLDTLQALDPKIVVYMWHPIATHWMCDRAFQVYFPNAKHVSVLHDLTQHDIDNFSVHDHNCGIPYAITMNPTLVSSDRVFVSTKLRPDPPTIAHRDSLIPIIGYQGFAGEYKGVIRLAHLVNEEFDICIFRLHMPYSWFADKDGEMTRYYENEVRKIITKPHIRVETSNHMMDTQELVNWLSQNTINCYLHSYPVSAGLASSPDYAIAARRPIAVSNNHMLKHFAACSPSVVVNEPYSLKQIIANGFAPIEPLYQAYSKENFLKDWSNIFDRLLGKTL